MRKAILVIASIALVIYAAAPAHAHLLWFNISQYETKPGETVWIEIGWGHKYPRDLSISDKWLEQVYVLDPKGREIGVEKIFPGFHRFTPTTKGAYQVIAKLKSGFLSITTDGHKLGSKKELTDVVSCLRYVMNAKALIEVGGKKNGFSETNNEPIEIVPLKDPAGLKVGDTLPVQVMFEGKPLLGAKLQVSNTAHASEEKIDWVIEQDSDSEGIVRVKLDSAGQWLFKANHKTPYPDKTEADEYSYTTSLTVGI